MQPAIAEVGDLIEHTLMPGFLMRVQAVLACEVDSNRSEPHDRFEIIDPVGNRDWLCAYDVRWVSSAPIGQR
jgi:hypothetical protein